MVANNYHKFWEDLGREKSESYLDYKFRPTHRIGLTNHLREELIYKFLNPQKTDVVLDVGCASGRQLFKLADKIKEGHGIDIAQSFIDHANETKEQKNLNNLFFKQAVIEKLPFAEDSFDKIICAEVFEHVFDENIALAEVLRVLKKNGILIITVPNFNADGTLWGRFLRSIGTRKFIPIKEFSREELLKHGDAHVREFSAKTLVGWLKVNNLEILDLKPVSFIDGPYFDFLLKFPLHVGFIQKLIIKFEQFLMNLNLFFGRHLIIKLRKK